MRKRLTLRMTSLLTLAGLALGSTVGVLPDAASAQTGAGCLRQVYVQNGVDENGEPTYGYALRNVCENPGSDGSSGGTAVCQHSELGEVPCYDPDRGWWSASWECYVSPMSPQPPPGDEAWEGHAPSEGAVYLFSCPVPAGGYDVRTGFLAEAPDTPSITDLARQAMESLPLAPASIGIAPDPDGVGLVGVPVWLWTEDTAATWGPVSVSVPGPGITVTAQGNAEQIAWDMGDGTTVICEAPGTPYDPSYGGQRSPDCGHVYRRPSLDQPGGRYQITATTTWHVRWWVEPQGSGAEGEDWFVRESSTSVEIHELQVVTS